MNSAKAAFEVLGKVNYLIKELHQEEGLFIYKNNDFNDVAKLIYDKLVEKNVHPIRINFPMREDINRKNRSDFYCTQLLTSYEKLVENGDIEPPYYLDKITNIKKNVNGQKQISDLLFLSHVPWHQFIQNLIRN